MLNENVFRCGISHIVVAVELILVTPSSTGDEYRNYVDRAGNICKRCCLREEGICTGFNNIEATGSEVIARVEEGRVNPLRLIENRDTPCGNDIFSLRYNTDYLNA